jgi:hypothetical protein
LEVLCDLLEGARDGFVFAVVEELDEVLDGVARGAEFTASRGELLAPAGEVFVLLEGFLVDVGVLLESLVDLFEFADELCRVSLVRWS